RTARSLKVRRLAAQIGEPRHGQLCANCFRNSQKVSSVNCGNRGEPCCFVNGCAGPVAFDNDKWTVRFIGHSVEATRNATTEEKIFICVRLRSVCQAQ